ARRGGQRRRSADAIPAVKIASGIASNVPTALAPENPLRSGMPALDTVHSRIVIASPKDSSRSYTVLRSAETDVYEFEKAAAAGRRDPSVSPPVPAGDNYQGTARKAAKLSIAGGASQSFTDLSKLLQSLPADSDMVKLKPPISTAASSHRVSKEKR